MQTPEKLTPTFVAKLAALSVLLSIGAIIKSPKAFQPAAVKNITDFVVPASASDQDSLHLQKPYRKLANYKPSNATSI